MFFKVFKLNYKIITFFILIGVIGFSLFYNVNANNEDCVRVPIIMYHSILKDTSKSGKYTISPTLLESDFKYLKDNNFSPIFMQDLIDYVYEDSPLPDNPIIITFDDGYYNNYEYVLPLLEKYEFKAVISIVGNYTDKYSETGEANPNYGYLRWCDINSAMQSGYLEFQNHSYDMHSGNGSMIVYNESLEHYKLRFSNDISKLQNEFKDNTGYIPTTYTYPFGGITNGTTDILKDLGFRASLSCTSGVNYISSNSDCLYCLKRNNRPANISSETFFNKINIYP